MAFKPLEHLKKHFIHHFKIYSSFLRVNITKILQEDISQYCLIRTIEEFSKLDMSEDLQKKEKPQQKNQQKTTLLAKKPNYR